MQTTSMLGGNKKCENTEFQLNQSKIDFFSNFGMRRRMFNQMCNS